MLSGLRPFLQITENAPIGTVAGHLHATDPDPNDILTFSLSPNVNNSSFSIENNGSVRTTSPIDFEQNASHLLSFRVTDQHGAFVDGNVTVKVIDLFRPFTETGLVQSVTETSVILQGSVIDDGGMQITERGFLLSSKPDLDAGARGVIHLVADQSSPNFSSNAVNLQSARNISIWPMRPIRKA